jgi:hypothetical protein
MSKLDLSNYEDSKRAFIYHHFDGKLLEDTSNPHRIYTPVNLCEEILAKMDITHNKLYLVMYNPEFVWVLKNKYNIDPEQIILWTLEYSEFHENLCRKFKCNPHFGWDFDGMKFNVVVGNPPFQDESNDSTCTNLWADIYIKSFESLTENGFMAMITPKTWAAPKIDGRRSQTGDVANIIKDHAIFVNIDECSKYFSVGSTFSFSVVSKKKNKNPVTFQLKNDKIVFDDIQTLILRMPKEISKDSVSIFKKIYSTPQFKKENGTTLSGKMIHDRDRNTNNSKTYPFRVQFSQGTIKWSDTKNKFQDYKKVLFPNQTTQNFPIYDSGISAPPNRGAVFVVESDLQGNNFVSFVKSKIMQFAISQQRCHHGLLNTSVISCIPKIDLDRSWTDQELYAHFGLTEDEIALIERSVQ